MGLFRCRGCQAKDGELAFLRAQLQKQNEMLEGQHRRLAELAEPGISMRIAGATRFEKRPVEALPPRPVRMQGGFPGYGPEPARPALEVDEPADREES